MFFFRKRDAHRQLIESQRALAFAAGFRCGQEATLCSLGNRGPAIVGWEKEEALNAVNHGFTQAKEFAPADKVVAA
jgi:hypothetical protein